MGERGLKSKAIHSSSPHRSNRMIQQHSHMRAHMRAHVHAHMREKRGHSWEEVDMFTKATFD